MGQPDRWGKVPQSAQFEPGPQPPSIGSRWIIDGHPEIPTWVSRAAYTLHRATLASMPVISRTRRICRTSFSSAASVSHR